MLRIVLELVKRAGWKRASVWVCCAALLGGCAVAIAGGSLLQRWTEAVRTKGWVTAFLRYDRDLGMYLVVVRVGDREQVVYRPGPADLQIAEPVFSPDGTRLAFLKVENADGVFLTRIYTMAIDGRDLRRLVEYGFPEPRPRGWRPTRGGHLGITHAAWTHDGKRLALLDREPVTWRRQRLVVVDAQSGATVPLVAPIGQHREGSGVVGDVITSQAWAPDNRRLVYMNDQGHVIILDTVTLSEEDLGPGIEPTWSPDGTFVAFQESTEAKGRWGGDYVVVAASAPRQRSLLLSNARTRGLGYTGPPIWSPDGRFLLIWYYPGEQGFRYVVDRLTGEVAKLPLLSVGKTVAGRP